MEKRIQVLIVDDQGSARRGLKALLSLFPQVEVVGEAADGQESVQQVEHCRPNVVLMDMQMPGTNGLEATRRIKCRWPKVKIIALTLHPGYQAEAFAAGADAFLLKGCDPELLRDAILASAVSRSAKCA